MARTILDFHNILVGILGTNYVYHQAPENFKLHYPCILYDPPKIENIHANDKSYIQKRFYKTTVIDEDPDSAIVDRISKMDCCRYERSFVSDGLYHTVFVIYY